MSQAPRMEASCTAHGVPLAMCDHCASTRVMGAWASSLSGEELAAALGKLAWSRSWYAHSETHAILAEAARRIPLLDTALAVMTEVTRMLSDIPPAGPATPAQHEIVPLPGSVQDRDGRRCDRAAQDSYPLSALCSQCHEPAQAMAGDAPWIHSAVLPGWMRASRGRGVTA